MLDQTRFVAVGGVGIVNLPTFGRVVTRVINDYRALAGCVAQVWIKNRTTFANKFRDIVDSTNFKSFRDRLGVSFAVVCGHAGKYPSHTKQHRETQNAPDYGRNGATQRRCEFDTAHVVRLLSCETKLSRSCCQTWP